MLFIEKRSLATFWKNKTAIAGLILIVLLVFAAVFANIISPYDVRDQDIRARYSPSGTEHILGTDDLGRDVFSRILVGSRVSLFVGVSSVLLAMLVGVFMGIIAGYKKGWIDALITRVIDGLMTFPSLILGIMVVSVIGPGLRNTIIAIAIALIPRFARISRAATIVLRESEFILASRSAGGSGLRIIFYHIIPNLMGELVVMASLWIATTIRIESSLSFLGLGVQPPMPSWGMMLKAGVDEILIAPWLAVYPGLAICLAVFGFNLIGDGLRDVLDPKTLR